MQSDLRKQSFFLGPWRIKPMLNRIKGPSGTVVLEPRLMRMLVFLVENAGDVVSRDALMEAVWEGTIISESSLTSSISELRRILKDDPQNPRFIETIRKRGYRMIAPFTLVEDIPTVASSALSVSGDGYAGSVQEFIVDEGVSRNAMWGIGGLLIAVLVLASGYLWIQTGSKGEARITPLTTLPGIELGPVFSPDGSRVAFVRLDGAADRADIYVQTVEDGVATRLTNLRGAALYPAWSPDGERIAFVWNRPDACSIFITSSLGGAVRKLIDLNHTVRHLDWVSQGDWLVFSYAADADDSNRIYRLHTTTLHLEPITSPQIEEADIWPIVSPDGEEVAFQRMTSSQSMDLFVLGMQSDAKPKRLTFDDKPIFGHDWTPDGKRVLFAAMREQQQGIWDIAASGGTPDLVRVANQHETAYLRVAPHRNRMTYVQWQTDVNLWQLPGPKANPNQGATRLPMASTYAEGYADYSPDGFQIVFVSDRSGTAELWKTDLTNEQTVRLTRLENPTLTRPRWSPSGRRIAFEMRTNGQADIYIIDATGGIPQQATHSDYDEIAPSWSADGTSLYYGSNQTGAWQVWEQERATGKTTQITQDGGYIAHATPDGKALYLTKNSVPAIYRYSLEDASYRAVTDTLTNQNADSFVTGRSGLYYTAWDLSTGVFRFYLLPYEEEDPLELAHFPRNLYFYYYQWGMAVSPDERALIVSHIDQGESNLMLADNLY